MNIKRVTIIKVIWEEETETLSYRVKIGKMKKVREPFSACLSFAVIKHPNQ